LARRAEKEAEAALDPADEGHIRVNELPQLMPWMAPTAGISSPKCGWY
jgi:hypothetical protein